MSKRPLVFLDTETTGLGPDRRAWEIALVRREPDGTEQALEFFLPIDASRAEPGALNIGRYYQRHPHGLAATRITAPARFGAPCPPPAHVTPVTDAAKRLSAWTASATIVGANPAFDTYVLERMLRSQGFEPLWHYRTRDVEAMATGFIGDEDLGGLAACAAALGVTVDKALEHTAMGDVRVAMAIYDRVILGDPEFHQVAEAAQQEVP